MKSVWTIRIAVAAMMVVAAMPTQAQGKEKKATPVVVTSKGEVIAVDKKADKAVTKAVKADEQRDKKVAKAVRKHVTTSQAVIVTRDVLVANHYQIVNVAPSGATQVIYYRRGNMGKGRGLGPVQKIYVVPSGEVVRFTSVPDALLGTILRRLGM